VQFFGGPHRGRGAALRGDGRFVDYFSCLRAEYCKLDPTGALQRQDGDGPVTVCELRHVSRAFFGVNIDGVEACVANLSQYAAGRGVRLRVLDCDARALRATVCGGSAGRYE
jgi:hypothetical protein